MSSLILFGIIVLNVLISIANCYTVGVAWKDTMTLGSKFNRLVLWSAIIQSGVGFSMPILIGLTWGSTQLLTMSDDPTLTTVQARQFMEWVFNLWYIAVIFPVLGTGFIIWAYSLREAYRQRDFASIATSGWNTFAQIHNSISAIENVGGAFGSVSDLFRSALDDVDDWKGAVAIGAILVALISLVGGFMIAFYLVRHFAKTSESRIEAYGNEHLARRH